MRRRAIAPLERIPFRWNRDALQKFILGACSYQQTGVHQRNSGVPEFRNHNSQVGNIRLAWSSPRACFAGTCAKRYPTFMFISFLHELKAAGIPVTLREYLTLMEAMEA